MLSGDYRKHRPEVLNSSAMARAGLLSLQQDRAGHGIAVCVIDYGFDLAHPSLRAPDGKTRFAALVEQNAASGGRIMDRDEINATLREVDCAGTREPLDRRYDPHANYFGEAGVQLGAHGTWVASIAAGSRGPNFAGIAPDADIIGVQLNLPDEAWREIDAAGAPSWLAPAQAGKAAAWGRTGWRAYDESTAIIAALY